LPSIHFLISLLFQTYDTSTNDSRENSFSTPNLDHAYWLRTADIYKQTLMPTLTAYPGECESSAAAEEGKPIKSARAFQ
jgi:hypothetical protein